MKRIYDSGAVERSDDDPFAPGTRTRGNDVGDGGSDGRDRRAIDWAAFSHAFTPTALRYRAIDVSVSTDKSRYEPGEPVAITVEFRNRLPFPIRIRTDSPNRWTWAVDGLRQASRVPKAVPERPAAFDFGRSERKRFRRRWPQRIRVTDDEWVPVDPGRYTIEVGLARDDASDRGLVDSTEIEIID
ncbi:hypothetical protein [Natrinema salifodinae]|uniref:DUF7974 domain-containing protein n=1 Tax=Natrinema salifodinae TaxID=1202768 RepID=A0A1I0NKB1_9EURY|nr:hypothetical protein [Natrinema salifodinae]SEW01673.1 hypothetical protein SAMN05216285_1814 [Natrinema salifodinae]